MKRIHSIEVHEQIWMPGVIRNAVTDYLAYGERVMKVYDPITGLLGDALRETNSRKIIDLCSGGTGPWETLKPLVESELGETVEVALTDLHPNADAGMRVGSEFTYAEESVNALSTPGNLEGFRTLFTGFHHFRPAESQRILEDAMKHDEGIAVFEMTPRSVKSLFAICFSPISLWLFTPAIQPFRWSRLLFTYLIPIVPLVILWDGWVSCLRTYTIAEMNELVSGLDEYEWKVGEHMEKGMPLPIPYLIGMPKREKG